MDKGQLKVVKMIPLGVRFLFSWFFFFLLFIIFFVCGFISILLLCLGLGIRWSAPLYSRCIKAASLLYDGKKGEHEFIGGAHINLPHSLKHRTEEGVIFQKGSRCVSSIYWYFIIVLKEAHKTIWCVYHMWNLCHWSFSEDNAKKT